METQAAGPVKPCKHSQDASLSVLKQEAIGGSEQRNDLN